MKAVLINDDKSLSWSEVEDPKISSEEVLVKIEAAALNRADLMQREGNYPPPPGCPQWMGLEIAGTVVEIGEDAKKNSSWKIGDKVCALLGGGGYAQYVAVKYDMLMPVPKGFSVVEAAAMPEAYATAYLNLFWEAGAKEGDTLLMQAGASGLASVVIPMAKAFGMRVVTTVRSNEDKEAIAHLGADVVINTRELPLVDFLKSEAEQGRTVDVAIDCVGGSSMGQCLPYLSHGARWIMIASLAGELTEINLRTVFVKNIRIIGSTLRSRKPEVKAKLLAELVEKLWPLAEKRIVSPTVYKTLPITEAEAAHDILYRGENVGKVVLTVD